MRRWLLSTITIATEFVITAMIDMYLPGSPESKVRSTYINTSQNSGKKNLKIMANDPYRLCAKCKRKVPLLVGGEGVCLHCFYFLPSYIPPEQAARYLEAFHKKAPG